MIYFASSCSLKVQVVSEGGIWRKLQLTHSVRAHFGFQESYQLPHKVYIPQPILIKIIITAHLKLWLQNALENLSICVFVCKVDLQEKLVGGTFLKQQMHNFKSSYAESRPSFYCCTQLSRNGIFNTRKILFVIF